MTWLERLSCAPRRLEMEGGALELLGWNYAAELRDNVPHRHTFYEVCLVGARGGAHFIVENRRHGVGPGDVFFARPGAVHQIVNTQRRGLELFWLSWAWRPQGGAGRPAGEVARLMDAFAASGHLVSTRDARVGAAWLALREAAAAPATAGQDAQLAASITALVLAIAQSGAPELGAGEPLTPGRQADAGETAARAAVRYIADNLDGDLSAETLAAYLHLSPRHFARVFTAFTGSSPSVYIERARLHRAADLLSHSPLAVKEIAARVGYADVRYFTRRFARMHGLPPATYRERGEGRVQIIHNPGDIV